MRESSIAAGDVGYKCSSGPRGADGHQPSIYLSVLYIYQRCSAQELQAAHASEAGIYNIFHHQLWPYSAPCTSLGPPKLLLPTIEANRSTHNGTLLTRVMECFRKWFSANGGFLNSSAQIMEVEEGRHYVRVGPGYEVGENETLISCPNDLSFNFATCCKRDASKSVSKIDMRSLQQNIAVRLALMEQYLLGQESFWWPYISILPQPFHKSTHLGNSAKDAVCHMPSQSFHTPLYFNDEDLLWLIGTNLGGAVRERGKAWEEEFEMAKDALKSLDDADMALWTRLAQHDKFHHSNKFDSV